MEDEKGNVTLSDSPIADLKSYYVTPVQNGSEADNDYYKITFTDGKGNELTVPEYNAQGQKYVYYLREITEGDYTTVVDSQGDIYVDDDLAKIKDSLSNSKYVLNGGYFTSRLEAEVEKTVTKDFKVDSIQDSERQYSGGSDSDQNNVILALQWKSGDSSYSYMDLKVNNDDSSLTITLDDEVVVKYNYDSTSKTYTIASRVGGWPSKLSTTEHDGVTFLTYEDSELGGERDFAYLTEDASGQKYYRRGVYLNGFNTAKDSNSITVLAPFYDFSGAQADFRWVETYMTIKDVTVKTDFDDLDGFTNDITVVGGNVEASGQDMIGAKFGSGATTCKIATSSYVKEEDDASVSGDADVSGDASVSVSSADVVLNQLIGDINVVATKTWTSYHPEDLNGGSTVSADFQLYIDDIEITYANKDELSAYSDILVFDDTNQKVYIKTSYYEDHPASLAVDATQAQIIEYNLKKNLCYDPLQTITGTYEASKDGKSVSLTRSFPWNYLPRFNEEGQAYEYTIQEKKITPSDYYYEGTRYYDTTVVVDNPGKAKDGKDQETIANEEAKISNVRPYGIGGHTEFWFYLDKDWYDGSDVDCRKTVTMDIVRTGNDITSDDGDGSVSGDASASEDKTITIKKGDVIARVEVGAATNWEVLYKTNAISSDDKLEDYIVVEHSMGGVNSSIVTKYGYTTEDDGSYNLGRYTEIDKLAEDYSTNNVYKRDDNKKTFLDTSTQEELESKKMGTLAYDDTDKDKKLNHYYNVYSGFERNDKLVANRYEGHYYSVNQRVGTLTLQASKDWYDGASTNYGAFAVYKQNGLNYVQVDATLSGNSGENNNVLLANGVETGVDYTKIDASTPKYNYAVIGHVDGVSPSTNTWTSGEYQKYDKKGNLNTYIVREAAIVMEKPDSINASAAAELEATKLTDANGKEYIRNFDFGKPANQEYGIPKDEILDFKGQDGDNYTITVGEMIANYSDDHSSGDNYSVSATNKRVQTYGLSYNVIWRDNGNASSYSTKTNGEDLTIKGNEEVRPDISARVFRTTIQDLLKAGVISEYSNDLALTYLQGLSKSQVTSLANSSSTSGIEEIEPSQRVWDTTTGSDWYWTCDLGQFDRYDENGYPYIYFLVEDYQGNTSGTKDNYSYICYNSVKTYVSYTTDDDTSKYTSETNKEYRPAGDEKLVYTYDSDGNITGVTTESGSPLSTYETFLPMPEVDANGKYLASDEDSISTNDSWSNTNENWGEDVLIISDGGCVTVGADTSDEEYGNYYSKTFVNYRWDVESMHGKKVWKLSNSKFLDTANLPDITLYLYASYREQLTTLDSLMKDGALVAKTLVSNTNNYSYSFPSQDMTVAKGTKDEADAAFASATDALYEYVTLTRDDVSYNVDMTRYLEKNKLPEYDELGQKIYYYVMEDTTNSIFNTNYDTPGYISSGDLTVKNTYNIEGGDTATVTLSKDWTSEIAASYRKDAATTTFKLYAQWQKADASGTLKPIAGTAEAVSKCVVKGKADTIKFTELNIYSSIFKSGSTYAKIPYYAPNGQPYYFYVTEVTPDGYELTVGGTTYSYGSTNTITLKEGVLSYTDKNGKNIEYDEDTKIYTTSEGKKFKKDSKDNKYYYVDDKEELTNNLYEGGLIRNVNYDGEQTLNNEFNPPTQKLTINKNWDDYKNFLATRPDGITFTVSASLPKRSDATGELVDPSTNEEIFTFDVTVKKADATGKLEATLSNIQKGAHYDDKVTVTNDDGTTTETRTYGYVKVSDDGKSIDIADVNYSSITASINGSLNDDAWNAVIDGLPTYTPNSDAFTYKITEKPVDETDEMQRLVKNYEGYEKVTASVTAQHVDVTAKLTNKTTSAALKMNKKIYQRVDGVSKAIDPGILKNLLKLGTIPAKLYFKVQYTTVDSGFKPTNESVWNDIKCSESDSYIKIGDKYYLGGTLDSELILSGGTNDELEWTVPVSNIQKGKTIYYRVVEVDSAGNQSNEFEVMLAYTDADGKPVYTDAEGNAISVSSDENNGTTVGTTDKSVEVPTSTADISNTVDLIPIEIKKVWEDNNNEDDTRPDSITITVTDKEAAASANSFDVVMTKAANAVKGDSNVYTSGLVYLPKPALKNGQTMLEALKERFKLKEKTGKLANSYDITIGEYTSNSDETSYGSSSKISGNRSQAVITNKIPDTYEPKTIDLTAEKIWEDDEEWAELTRPSKVDYELYYYNYAQKAWRPASELASVAAGSDLDLTNPTTERTSNLPESLKEKTTITLTGSNSESEWTAEWKDLYQYWWPTYGDNGALTEPTLFRYAVRETIYKADGTTVLYQSSIRELTDGNKDTEDPDAVTNNTAYTSSAKDYISEKTFVKENADDTGHYEASITNTLQTTSVKYRKQWLDESGNEITDLSRLTELVNKNAIPATLNFKLQYRTTVSTWTDFSDTYMSYIDMNSDGKVDSTDASLLTSFKAGVSIADAKTGIKWSNLPATDGNGETIEYRIVETGGTYKNGNTVTINDNTSTGDMLSTNGALVKNNVLVRNLTLTKIWDDQDNADNKRQDVKITLYQGTKNASGEIEYKKFGDTQTLTSSNVDANNSNLWTKTISDLPVKDANGDFYYYKVVETAVGYYNTITYKYTTDPGKTSAESMILSTNAEASNKAEVTNHKVKLTLSKYDSKTGNPIADESSRGYAKFKLEPADTSVDYFFDASADNGKSTAAIEGITSANCAEKTEGKLVPGCSYKLTETSPAPGYEFAADNSVVLQVSAAEADYGKITIVSQNNLTSEMESTSYSSENKIKVTNTPIEISLKKLGDNKVTLKGATFELKNADLEKKLADGKTSSATFTTGDDGTINITAGLVAAGETYELKETVFPANCESADPVIALFTVNADGTATIISAAYSYTASVSFINEDSKVKLALKNEDVSAVSERFSGFAFELKSSSGNLANGEASASISIGSDGTADISSYVAKGGKYTLTMTSVPEDYKVKENDSAPDPSFDFEVGEDGSASFTENFLTKIIDAVLGTKKYYKTTTITLTPTAGAGSMGADSKGQNTIVTVNNKLVSGTIKKVDYDTGNALSGVEFTLFGTFAALEGSNKDEYKGNTSSESIKLTTGADGTITIPAGILIVGNSYTLQETSVGNNTTYKLDSTELTFTVNADGSLSGTDTDRYQVVTDSNTKETTITAKDERIKLSFAKTDASDASKGNLTGAYFKLSRYTNAEKTATEVIKSNITSASDVVVIGDGDSDDEQLTAGSYVLEETKAPDGYKLITKDDANKLYFTIAKDGKVTVDDATKSSYFTVDTSDSGLNQTKAISMADEQTNASLTKTDLNGAAIDAVRGGAEFNVEPASSDGYFAGTSATGGSTSTTAITVSTDSAASNYIGTALQGQLVSGQTYKFTETKAPAGYELNTYSNSATDTTPVVFTVTVNANGTLNLTADTPDDNSDVEDQKGYVSVAANSSAISVKNKPIELTISKIGESESDKLAGATFILENEDSSEYLADGTTKSLELTTVGEEGKIAIPSALVASGETYILTETTAPAGYECTAVVTFTVEDDGTADPSQNTIIQVSDEKVRASLVKLGVTNLSDDASTGTKLQGAQFTLSGTFANGVTVPDPLTTDENGAITIPEGALIVGNTYTLKETSVGDDTTYRLDSAALTFTVKADGSLKMAEGTSAALKAMYSFDSDNDSNIKDTTVTVKNEKLKLEINKVSNEAANSTLPGVGLTLKKVIVRNESQDGESAEYVGLVEEPVSTWTTEDSAQKFDDLTSGYYELTETSRLAGYLQHAPVYFKLNQDNKVALYTKGSDGKLTKSLENDGVTPKTSLGEEKDGDKTELNDATTITPQLTLTNTVIRGHVSLNKIALVKDEDGNVVKDAEGNDVTRNIENAVFSLFKEDAEGDIKIAEGLQTKSDGKWTTLNNTKDSFTSDSLATEKLTSVTTLSYGLTAGTYYLMETGSDDTYLDDHVKGLKFTFEIRDASGNNNQNSDHYDSAKNNVVQVDGDTDTEGIQSINNTSYKAKIQIKKTEEEKYNYAAISGAKFDIWYSGHFDTKDGHDVYHKLPTTLTEGSGGIYSAELTAKGKYLILETTNKGYEVTDVYYSFELKDEHYNKTWNLKQTSSTISTETIYKKDGNTIPEATTDVKVNALTVVDSADSKNAFTDGDGIENTRRTINIQLTKYEKGTTNPLSKVIFNIYKTSDIDASTGEPKEKVTALDIQKTDDNGILTFMDLDWDGLNGTSGVSDGKYTIVEIEAQGGYHIRSNINVDLTRNQFDAEPNEEESDKWVYYTSDDAANEKMKLVITKTDTSDTPEYLDGAKFAIYKAEDVTYDFSDSSDGIVTIKEGASKVLDESVIITKDGGSYTIEGTLVGGEDYALVEVTPPQGYKASAPVYFHVTKKGKIEVLTETKKKDESEETETIEKIDHTSATIEEATFKDNGDYNTDNKITVKDKEIEIELSKEDFDSSKDNNIGSKKLSGATFDVTGTFAGNTVSPITVTIPENGGTIDGLKGKLIAGNIYTFTETTAPEGYEKMSFSVTIDEYGKATVAKDDSEKDRITNGAVNVNNPANVHTDNTNLEIADKPNEIFVAKLDADDSSKITATAATYKLEPAENSYFAMSVSDLGKADDRFKDGQNIAVSESDNTKIASITLTTETSGANAGKVVIPAALLITGKSYILTETTAPQGYELASAPVTFTVKDDGDGKGSYAEISGTSTEYSVNTSDKTCIDAKDTKITIKINKEDIDYADKGAIEKTGHTDTGLEGAVFKVNGKFAAASENSDILVYVKSNGTLVEAEAKKDDNSSYEKASDNEALTGKLVAGREYTFTEVQAPEGYKIYNTTDAQLEFTIKVRDDGTYELVNKDVNPETSEVVIIGKAKVQGATKSDDGVITTNKTASESYPETSDKLTVWNTPIKISLKKIGETSATLSGAEFKLTAQSGSKFSYLATVDKIDGYHAKSESNSAYVTVTTGDGTIQIPEGVLVVGNSYQLEETKAPDGYECTTIILFTVNEHGLAKITSVTGGHVTVNGTTTNYNVGGSQAGQTTTLSDNTITASDEKIRASLTKQDINAEATKLSGVTYTLKPEEGSDFVTTDLKTGESDNPRYDASTKILTLTTTGTDGKIDIPEGALIVGNSYTLTETSVGGNTGYKLPTNASVTFKVEKNGTLTFTNGTWITGSGTSDSATGKATITGKDEKIKLKLGKIADDDKKTSAMPTYLAGAKLELTSSTGADLTKVTITDDSGLSISADHKTITIITKSSQTMLEGLPAGSYTLQEVIAPEGYKNGDDITFTIGTDGTVTEVNATETKNVSLPKEISDSVLVSIGSGTEAGNDKAASLNMTDVQTDFDLVKINKTTGAEVDQSKYDEPKFTVKPYGNVTGSSTEASHFAKGSSADGKSELTDKKIGDLKGLLVESNSYEFTETYASKGYELADSFIVTVSADGKSLTVKDKDGNELTETNGFAYFKTVNGVAQLYLKDQPIDMTIRKLDIDGNLIKTNAVVTSTEAEFTLAPASGSAFADGSTAAKTYTTDDSQKIIDSAILVANNIYTLTEKVAPDSYEIAAAVTFKVGTDGDILLKDSDGNYTVKNSTNAEYNDVKDTLIKINIQKTFEGASTGKTITNDTNSKENKNADAMVLTQGATFRITCVGSSTFAQTNAKTSLVKKDSSGNDYIDVTVTGIDASTGVGTVRIPDGVLKQKMTYHIEEIATSDGYQLDSSKAGLNFYVNENGKVTTISNNTGSYTVKDDTSKDTLARTNIKIKFFINKASNEANGTLKGVGLTLKKADVIKEEDNTLTLDKNSLDSAESIVWTTSSGAKEFDGLSAGFYELTETGRPVGYVQHEPVYFKVNQDNTIKLYKLNGTKLEESTDTYVDKTHDDYTAVTNDGNNNYTVTMTNTLIRGHVSLNKTFTDEDKTKVKDAVFTLYKKGTKADGKDDQKVIEGIHTDSNGNWTTVGNSSVNQITNEALSKGLTIGTYYFIETGCDTSYLGGSEHLLNVTKYEFTITDASASDANGSHYITAADIVNRNISNIKYTATVNLLKTEDAAHSYEAIKDAVFALYYKGEYDSTYSTGWTKIANNNRDDGNYVTDENGKISVTLDRKGEYYFKEISNTAYEIPATEWHFKLTDNEYNKTLNLKPNAATGADNKNEASVTTTAYADDRSDGITNTRLTGGMELEKVDTENAATKLDMVEFNLYQKAADSNDSWVVQHVVKNQDGSYSISNAEGATISLVTDSNGKIKVTGLDFDKWGHYKLVEVTPHDGYKTCADKTFDITREMVGNNQIKSLTTNGNEFSEAITNTQNELTIQKLDRKDNSVILREATFKIFTASDYAAGNTTAEYVKASGTTSVTDGKYKFKGKLVGGTDYVLVEDTAPAGYEIAPVIYFTMSKDGVVSLALSGNTDGYYSLDSCEGQAEDSINQISIKDDAITIDLTKADMSGLKIEDRENAVFTVTPETGKKFADGSETQTITLENGQLNGALEGLLIAGDTYKFTENTAPRGYECATVILKVNRDGTFTSADTFDGKAFTSSHGDIICQKDAENKDTDDVTIKDDIVKVSLRKADAAGNLITESNATFTITPDQSTNPASAFADSSTEAQTFTTTNGVLAITAGILVAGNQYIIQEITAPEGYETVKMATIKVKADGTVEFVGDASQYAAQEDDSGIEQITVTDSKIDMKIIKEDLLYKGKHDAADYAAHTNLEGAVFTVSGRFANEAAGTSSSVYAYVKADNTLVKAVKADDNTYSIYKDGNEEVSALEGKLVAGETYTFTEVKAPDGFELYDPTQSTDTPVAFTVYVNKDGTYQLVKDGGTKAKEIQNIAKVNGATGGDNAVASGTDSDTLTVWNTPIEIYIQKIGESTNDKLSDTTFKLTDITSESNPKVIDRALTTNSDGQIKIPYRELVYGHNYELYETDAKDGYMSTVVIKFNVTNRGKVVIQSSSGGYNGKDTSNSDKTIQTVELLNNLKNDDAAHNNETLQISNEKIRALLIKMGTDGTTTQKLNGVTFEITPAREGVDRLTTNEQKFTGTTEKDNSNGDGTLHVSDALLIYGNYYYLTETGIGDANTKYKLPDAAAKRQVMFYVDRDGKLYFCKVNSEGQYIQKADGSYEYDTTATASPANSLYTLNDAHTQFTITNETIDLNIKKLGDDGKAIAGVTLILEKKTGSDWTNSEQIATWTTDAAGTVKNFKGLTSGIYRLRETSVPTDYKIHDPYEFTINQNGTITYTDDSQFAIVNPADGAIRQDQAAGSTAADANITFTNKVYRTKLQLTKKGADGSNLGGVTFLLEKQTVTRVDGESTTSYSPVTNFKKDASKGTYTGNDGKLTTPSDGDSKGIVTYENLENGIYRLTEVQTADGYNLLSKAIFIKINRQANDKLDADNNPIGDTKATWWLDGDGDDASKITTVTLTDIDNDGSKDAIEMTLNNKAGFTLPATGTSDPMLPPIALVIAVLPLTALLLASRKKKEKKGGNKSAAN